MNKIASSDFTVDNAEFSKPVDAISPATPKNSVVANLMKAWESKLTQRTAKGAGFTLMAVSLAACNDDDVVADDVVADDVVADDVVADDVVTDDVVADDVVADDVVTPTLSALQTAVADIVKSNVTGIDGVETAVLAQATNATILEVSGTTTAPTTDAATEEMIGDALEAVFAAAEGVSAGVTAQYTNLAGSTFTAADGATNFDLIVGALTGTTSTEKAAITTAVDAADSLLSAASVTATNAVLTATQAISASLTSAQSADLTAFKAPVALLATNAANATTNVDIVGATSVEIASGTQAYAASVVAAVITATGLTSTSANTAAATAALVAYIDDTVTSGIGVQLSSTLAAAALQNALIVDAFTGQAIGVNASADTVAISVTAAATATITVDLLAAAADALDGVAINLAAGGAAGTFGAAMEAITNAVATGDGSIGGTVAEVITVLGATYTATEISAIKADFDAVLDALDDVIAAQTAIAALEVEATVIELQNDGTAVVMATGTTAALSDDSDMVGYITDLDNSVTIGSSTESFGASGTDSLIIAGEYTFVTITEAQHDAIATVELGSASALEIFVYQDATSGDTVMHVERSAGEGDVEGATMSTITLTDTTFADLSSLVADGVTILSSEAAIV